MDLSLRPHHRSPHLHSSFQICREVQMILLYFRLPPSYKETLELNPKHIEARINYCNILYSLEMFDNAEICYLDVLSIQPDYVRALINLASLYSRSFGNMYNFMKFFDGE